jgi:hypothetical protein
MECVSTAGATRTPQLVNDPMTRRTRSVPNQMFIWMNDPIRLRQGARTLPFSTKFLWKKIKSTMLPQAILPFSG